MGGSLIRTPLTRSIMRGFFLAEIAGRFSTSGSKSRGARSSFLSRIRVLFGRQRSALTGLPDVTPDGGEARLKDASGIALAHTPVDSFDHFPGPVFRVCSHEAMI